MLNRLFLLAATAALLSSCSWSIGSGRSTCVPSPAMNARLDRMDEEISDLRARCRRLEREVKEMQEDIYEDGGSVAEGPSRTGT